MKRISWDQYFMQIAKLIGTRSTCTRRQVGAIAVKDKQVLATGYNGAPSNAVHCTEKTCIRSVNDVPSGHRHELCRAVHAEQNVVCQAALHGVSLKGATIYCTHFPCVICSKLLSNTGIEKIMYMYGYPDDLSTEFVDKMCFKITLDNI